jgi:NitT/TauT family transport system substrate-binding protein
VLHELYAGTLDAACLTLDEALAAQANGLDLKVLLVMDISAGGDALLADPSLTTLGELRGKTIAVENTAVGAILLDGALQAAGLQVADVKLKFASADEHLMVYRSGEVDAVVTFEPMRSRLLGEGALQLYDSRQIPDRIVDVLVAPAVITATRANQLRMLIQGHFDALEHRRRHPIDADRRMAPRLGATLDEVTAMFNGMSIPDLAENRRLLAGHKPMLEEAARQLIPVMQRAGQLHGSVDVAGMIEPRFLPPGDI